jgi:hypothetical protein
VQLCEKAPYNRLVGIALQTIKQTEQDEEDNGDLGANVEDEVRTKQHQSLSLNLLVFGRSDMFMLETL